MHLFQDGEDRKDDERMQRGGGRGGRAPRRFTRRFFRRKPRRPRSDTEGSQSGVEGETTNKVGLWKHKRDWLRIWFPNPFF